MDSFITGADRERIQAQLTPDEELLWSGKYEPSLLEFNCLLFMIFGLVFAGFSAIALLESNEGQGAARIIPPIFITVGLGIALLGPWLHIRHRSRWVYALTNKRAILLLHNQTRNYDIEPYMVLSSRASEHGLGKLVFERETRGSGKNRSTVEWGFLRCRGLAEPLRLLEDMLGGLALESSKSAAVRKQEREAELMKMAQFPYLLPILIIVQVASLGVLAYSISNILLRMNELRELGLSCTWEDLLFAAGEWLFIGLIASAISAYMLYACLRGRRLLRERNSDTP